MHIIMTGKWVCSVEISEWLIVEITPCKSIQFKIQRILFEWKPYAQWVAIAFISFDLIVGKLAGYCFPQTWRMHAKRKSTSFLHSIILLVFISRRDICLHIFICMTILLLTQTWICTIFFFWFCWTIEFNWRLDCTPFSQWCAHLSHVLFWFGNYFYTGHSCVHSFI